MKLLEKSKKRKKRWLHKVDEMSGYMLEAEMRAEMSDYISKVLSYITPCENRKLWPKLSSKPFSLI